MHLSTDLLVSSLGVLLEYPLECDGMTNVLSMILFDCDIPHKIVTGAVASPGTFETISWHKWIELQDGRVVDFKLGLWLEAPDLPFGVFNPSDYPGLIFVPNQVSEPRPSAFIANILTDGRYMDSSALLKAGLREGLDFSGQANEYHLEYGEQPKP